MTTQTTTVSVHQRLDAEGFVVKLVVHEGEDQEQVSKFACPTFEEAEALATSIKNYAELGLPLDVLLPEDVES